MPAGLAQALRDLLTTEPTLGSWFTSYGGAPAVFTADLAPADARMPFAVIGPAVTDTAEQMLSGGEGPRNVVHDVRIFAPMAGSADEIDAMGERLREILTGRFLTIPGFRGAQTRVVNGPIGVSADTDAYGRLVSVKVHLTR